MMQHVESRRFFRVAQSAQVPQESLHVCAIHVIMRSGLASAGRRVRKRVFMPHLLTGSYGVGETNSRDEIRCRHLTEGARPHSAEAAISAHWSGQPRTGAPVRIVLGRLTNVGDMEESNVPGWIALSSFVLAVGLLVRNRLRPDGEDLQTELMNEYITAMVASATLGSLPRLFGMEFGVPRVGIDLISFALAIFAFRQIIRAMKARKAAAGD